MECKTHERHADECEEQQSYCDTQLTAYGYEQQREHQVELLLVREAPRVSAEPATVRVRQIARERRGLQRFRGVLADCAECRQREQEQQIGIERRHDPQQAANVKLACRETA